MKKLRNKLQLYVATAALLSTPPLVALEDYTPIEKRGQIPFGKADFDLSNPDSHHVLLKNQAGDKPNASLHPVLYDASGLNVNGLDPAGWAHPSGTFNYFNLINGSETGGEPDADALIDAEDIKMDVQGPDGEYGNVVHFDGQSSAMYYVDQNPDDGVSGVGLTHFWFMIPEEMTDDEAQTIFSAASLTEMRELVNVSVDRGPTPGDNLLRVAFNVQFKDANGDWQIGVDDNDEMILEVGKWYAMEVYRGDGFYHAVGFSTLDDAWAGYLSATYNYSGIQNAAVPTDVDMISFGSRWNLVGQYTPDKAKMYASSVNFWQTYSGTVDFAGVNKRWLELQGGEEHIADIDANTHAHFTFNNSLRPSSLSDEYRVVDLRPAGAHPVIELSREPNAAPLSELTITMNFDDGILPAPGSVLFDTGAQGMKLEVLSAGYIDMHCSGTNGTEVHRLGSFSTGGYQGADASYYSFTCTSTGLARGVAYYEEGTDRVVEIYSYPQTASQNIGTMDFDSAIIGSDLARTTQPVYVGTDFRIIHDSIDTERVFYSHMYNRLDGTAPATTPLASNPDPAFHLDMTESAVYDSASDVTRILDPVEVMKPWHVHEITDNLVDSAVKLSEYNSTTHAVFADSGSYDGNVSMTMVFRATEAATGEGVLVDARASGYGMALTRNASEDLTVYCGNGATTSVNVAGLNSGDDTYRITAVCGGNERVIDVYTLNTGAQATQTDADASGTSTSNLAQVSINKLNADLNAASSHMGGAISDVRIYTSALAPATIAGLRGHMAFAYAEVNTSGDPTTQPTLTIKAEEDIIPSYVYDLPPNFQSCGGAPKMELSTGTLSFDQLANELLTPEDQLVEKTYDSATDQVIDTVITAGTQAFTDAVTELLTPQVVLSPPSQANATWRYFVANAGLNIKIVGASNHILENIPLDAYITVDIPEGATQPCWNEVYLFLGLDRVLTLLNPLDTDAQGNPQQQQLEIIDANGSKLSDMQNLGTTNDFINSFFPKQALVIKLGEKLKTTFPLAADDKFYAYMGTTPTGQIYNEFKKGRALMNSWKGQAAKLSGPKPAKKEAAPPSTGGATDAKSPSGKKIKLGQIGVAMNDVNFVGPIPVPGMLGSFEIPSLPNLGSIKIATSPDGALTWKPKVYSQSALNAGNFATKEDLDAHMGFSFPDSSTGDALYGHLSISGTGKIPAMPILNGTIDLVVNTGESSGTETYETWDPADDSAFTFENAPAMGINAEITLGIKLHPTADQAVALFNLGTGTANYFNSLLGIDPENTAPTLKPDLKFTLGAASFYWGQYTHPSLPAGENFWPDIKFAMVAGIGDAVDMVLNNVAQLEQIILNDPNASGLTDILADMAPTASGMKWGQFNRHKVMFGSSGIQAINLPGGVTLAGCETYTRVDFTDDPDVAVNGGLSEWTVGGWQEMGCNILGGAAYADMKGGFGIGGGAAWMSLDANAGLHLDSADVPGADSDGFLMMYVGPVGVGVRYLASLDVSGSVNFGTSGNGFALSGHSPEGFGAGFKVDYFIDELLVDFTIGKGMNAGLAVGNGAFQANLQVPTGRGIGFQEPDYPCLKPKGNWFWQGYYTTVCKGRYITIVQPFNVDVDIDVPL